MKKNVCYLRSALLLAVCGACLVAAAGASSQRVDFPRFLAADPNGCHCDGTEIHCSTNEQAEQYCECHDHDGTIEVHCQTVDSSCHCDGDVLHCSTGEDLAAALCHCHDGALECSGQGDSHNDHSHEDSHSDHSQADSHNSYDDPNACHCDGTEIHCSTNEEAEQYCECHDHDGIIEVHCQAVDSSCHCDGDILHCSAGEDLASALCHCHGGTMECSGQGDSHSNQQDEVRQDKPWAEVIVTCLLVNLVTLAGLFVVAGQWFQRVFCPNHDVSAETKTTWRANIIPMFACGAIMATTFFLILPEALHLIQDEFGDPHAGHNHRMMREKNPEAQATWRWGTSVLGGFLIAVLTHAVFPHQHHDHSHGEDGHGHTHGHGHGHDNEQQQLEADKDVADVTSDDNDKEDIDEQVQAQDDIEEQPPKQVEDNKEKKTLQEKWAEADEKYNIGLLMSLSVGDFFHQFADGVFIGTAWLLCTRDLAITIAVTTVIHCFPHQLADYLMMIHHCGLGVWATLLVNFVAGLGTVLGGIFVLGLDLSNAGIGAILAVGGGIFLNVAIAECLMVAQAAQKTMFHKLYGFLGFAVGCIPIGLVLLNHEHCGGH